MTSQPATGPRGGGRRHRLRPWLTRAAAGALLVSVSAACVFFPNGSWTTQGPVLGKPSLSWNDPDDGLTDSPLDLSDVGYVEAEHFIGGNATPYSRVGTWGPDGRWEAQAGTAANFSTRILIRRPADPADFNGVVVVEWLNVTSGRDLDANFRPTHTELLQKGYAWVGVSAQQVGVDDLKRRDPNHYQSLKHPGDAYAYDIFTQAGRIIADPTSPVLGGLHPQVLLAAGASQSASTLLTYINAVQPLAGVYDGFELVSHLGSAWKLGDGPDMPDHPIVRTDLDVPVLDVQTETDVVLFHSHLSRQDDSPHFRLWEVAGTAHIGEYGRSLTWPANPTTPGDPCADRINSAPTFAVAKAATAALAQWATTGAAPASAPRITLGDPAAADPVVRDQYGNAQGGIRYPHIEVPVGRVDGLANLAPAPGDPGPTFICALSGRTLPFSAEQLAGLYPTSADYVERFREAADQAVAAGFLLREDADMLTAAATASPPVP